MYFQSYEFFKSLIEVSWGGLGVLLLIARSDIFGKSIQTHNKILMYHSHSNACFVFLLFLVRFSKRPNIFVQRAAKRRGEFFPLGTDTYLPKLGTYTCLSRIYIWKISLLNAKN